MKKIIVMLVLAAFAAAPAAAAPKKKHEKKPEAQHELTFNEAMAYNRKNLSLLVQGLPLILPSWSLPFVFGLQKNDDKAKHVAKKR